MLEAVKYVIKENSENLFRIYSISKYEVLADMRDSKLGLLELCESNYPGINILVCIWISIKS